MPPHLPPEIWVSIFQFAANTASPKSPSATLLNISLTSKRFHHLIYCHENDATIWKIPAIHLGVHPDITLDEVLYSGTSFLQKRSWINFVKFQISWQKPFPLETKMPKSKKCFRELPGIINKGDDFVKRTFELCCSGQGRGLDYILKRPVESDKGNLVFEVRNIANDRTARAAGILEAGENVAKQVDGKMVPASAHNLCQYPVSAGYMVTLEGEDYQIKQFDSITGEIRYTWFLGKRKPDRFVSRKDILVALTFDDPEQAEPSPEPTIPSNFLSLKAGDPNPKWYFNVSVKWWNEDDDYRGFALVRTFHVSAKYLVVLITRHPSPALGKLTRTSFIVLSLETSEIINIFKIQSTVVSPPRGEAPGIPASLQQRQSFTTVFSHDFVLTDSCIICGGVGGVLLVFSISGDKASGTPIYIIPNEITDFPLLYNDLTLSVCGRYLAASTNSRLYVWDLIEKKIKSIYTNGRVLPSSDLHNRSPRDDFPSGIWVMWKDWRITSSDDSGDGEDYGSNQYWEEIGQGVGYLTDIADGLEWRNPFPAEARKMSRSWFGGLSNGLLDDYTSWIIVAGVGIILASLWTVFGIGKEYFVDLVEKTLNRPNGLQSDW